MKELWVEKYRPKTVDGYVFVDDSQREQVQQWIRDGSIPHLMLSGSAGTGKTTLAKLLINELGVDEYDVMYANGSKEARKVEWVDRLISFCQTMPFVRVMYPHPSELGLSWSAISAHSRTINSANFLL